MCNSNEGGKAGLFFYYLFSHKQTLHSNRHDIGFESLTIPLQAHLFG